jgi:predicted O-methyltransferase YrrM
MSLRTINLTPELYDYLLRVSSREPDVLRRLREETARLPRANCQISPEQGQFMALLLRLIGARRVLEIGTFTGYSSTAMALALPGDGRITCLDVNREWTDIARRFWREAGVEHKVELILGPALESLDRLLAGESSDAFDFAFIDADKEHNGVYYERCLRLVHPGGLIAVDNVLSHGRVIDESVSDAGVEAIREFNAALLHDERVDISLVPIADGLTLCRRR